MIRFVLIAIILLSSTNHLIAQINLDWVRSLCGNNESYISKIVADKDGNTYGIGQFQDSLSSLASRGLNDVLVFKYNENGDLIWLSQLGSVGDDWGNDITIDSIGNVYITGFYKNTFYYNNDSIPYKGKADAFVAKLDNTGQIHWVKGIGDSGNDIGNTIIADNIGNVYVAGTFEDSLKIDNQSLSIYGTNNNFILQLNSFGQLVWHNTISTPATNNIQDLQLDANGSIYLVGYFRDIVYGTLGQLLSYGHNDILLAKFSTNGHLAWWKKMGGLGVDLGLAIHINNNHLYITGVFQDTAYFDTQTQICDGEFDTFLAQCDLQGTVNWMQVVGGIDNSKGFDLATLENGNIYLVGLFEGTSRWDTDTASSRTPRHVPSNIFIAEYKTDGTYQSVKTIGNTETDYATGIYILDSTHIYVAGIFHDSVFFSDSLAIANAFNTAIFVCKYSKQNSVGIEHIQKNTLSSWIFPNPVTEMAIIGFELEQAATTDIILYNGLGQLVKTILSSQYSIGQQQISFKKENLPVGLYYITITTNRQQSVLPFVIN